MKNTILQVLQQTDFDRYVYLTYLNDEIIGLNFWQGVDQRSYESVMNDKGYEPCIHLTNIFNRLKINDKTATDEQRINKAIHLYINAFIIQEDELFLSNLKGSKKDHLTFLEGYLNSWEYLSETSKNEDWIEGANALYIAYCELNNLPKLSACDLIYELNKI
jgi:hypothetical protein